MTVRRFALDENFPTPIIKDFQDYIADATLVSIRDIDERMCNIDDWKLLLALHHHSGGWDGLITADSGILSLPRELSVLHQTKLTLVVTEAAGHDPLKATGLLFVHLPNICKRTQSDVAQLWRLSAAARPHHAPWRQLESVAQHRGTTADKMYAQHRLSDEELATNPLVDETT